MESKIEQHQEKTNEIYKNKKITKKYAAGNLKNLSTIAPYVLTEVDSEEDKHHKENRHRYKLYTDILSSLQNIDEYKKLNENEILNIKNQYKLDTIRMFYFIYLLSTHGHRVKGEYLSNFKLNFNQIIHPDVDFSINTKRDWKIIKFILDSFEFRNIDGIIYSTLDGYKTQDELNNDLKNIVGSNESFTRHHDISFWNNYLIEKFHLDNLPKKDILSSVTPYPKTDLDLILNLSMIYGIEKVAKYVKFLHPSDFSINFITNENTYESINKKACLQNLTEEQLKGMDLFQKKAFRHTAQKKYNVNKNKRWMKSLNLSTIDLFYFLFILEKSSIVENEALYEKITIELDEIDAMKILTPSIDNIKKLYCVDIFNEYSFYKERGEFFFKDELESVMSLHKKVLHVFQNENLYKHYRNWMSLFDDINVVDLFKHELILKSKPNKLQYKNKTAERNIFSILSKNLIKTIFSYLGKDFDIAKE